MEAEIRARPAFAHLAVSLQPGERLIAEAGAMASMSSSLELRTRWNGGIVRGLARRFLGGEAIFINEYTARAPGEVVLTQPFPGDLVRIDLQGETLYLQPGAFLACQPSVRLGLG
ncbi:MAG: TIGR00266 family protein, partial [bacterium]